MEDGWVLIAAPLPNLLQCVAFIEVLGESPDFLLQVWLEKRASPFQTIVGILFDSAPTLNKKLFLKA